MKSTFIKTSENQDMMFSTNGTNFSIVYNNPDEINNNLDNTKSKNKFDIKDKSGQVKNFLRIEREGISTIAGVASKHSGERNESEK